jgi:cytochrome c peroxidase
MKLQLLTLALCATLLIAACSKNDDGTVKPPPPVGECGAATPLQLVVPPGYPQMPVPDNNPTTVQGVELGRLLFYDPILSGDSTQACGSCHIQNLAFSDSRRFSEGISGAKGNRHAPAIVNPAYTGDTFWDGRVHSLEEQATKPVPNQDEMNLPWPIAIERLKNSPTYPDKFCAAFGDSKITVDRVTKAIAQFERTFISFNSKYDRVKRGEDTFTPEEAAGEKIFNSNQRGDCFHCHQAPLFTTNTFHNTGLDSVVVDRGRYDVTGNPGDLGKFKAPSLRNCADRFVFEHDSRFSIREAIEHYNNFHDGPGVDELIRGRLERPLLRAGEIDTLIIFLGTLSDPDFLTNPALSNPYAP